MYAGLRGIITDFSQVSDAGLAHAETYLTPAQVAQFQAISSVGGFPDVTAIAVQDGLLPASDANTNQYAPWTDSLRTTGLAAAIIANPALAGLFVAAGNASDSFDPNGPGPQVVLDNLTHPLGATPAFGTGMELPTGLPADAQAVYLASLTKYFNQLYNAKVAADNDTAQHRDNLVYLVLATARQNAMAQGTTTLGVTGGSGQNIVVATSLIRYQVELPDGTMYVVMDDVTGDPANRYVYQWLGPNWKPQAFAGDGSGWFERDGQSFCIGLVPGTGSWYTARVFGQVAPGSSCDGTPPGFTGPWDLVTPDISSQLTYQDGSPVQVVPPEQQIAITPTGGGGGGAAPDPTASPIPTPAMNNGEVPPMQPTVVPVSQPSPVLLQPSQNMPDATPVTTQVLPVASPQPNATGAVVALLVGGGLLAGLLLGKSRR